MKGMVFKNQPGALCFGQPILDKGQVTILVAAVKFVADDGMAEMREMDAELVFASGVRDEAQEGKFIGRARHSVRAVDFIWTSGGRRTARPTTTDKSLLDPVFGLRGRAVGADAILDGNNALFILAERGVNYSTLRRHVAVDDGKVFLFDRAAFENFSKFAGSRGIFRDQNNAAGFTIQAVDKVRRGRAPRQMQSCATDQTGHLTVLRRVTDQSGRFLDDQQVGVLVDDIEHGRF